jgi:hypothetical protein
MKGSIGYRDILWCAVLLSASAGILLFSFQLTRLVGYAVPVPVAWCIVMFLMSPLAGAGIGALFKMKAKGALGGAIAFGLILLLIVLGRR